MEPQIIILALKQNTYNWKFQVLEWYIFSKLLKKSVPQFSVLLDT